MPLTPGTRLGVYEVGAVIGRGGMGDVYRARDAKLRRDVALKVLPDAVATDPDRLARFQQEAHVLALLNHPNIGGIYGLEEADAAERFLERNRSLCQTIGKGRPFDQFEDQSCLRPRR